MRFQLTAVLTAVAVLASAQDNRPAADSPQATIRSTTQEVLLDVVVRDKKFKLIKDLTAKDFELSDDGEHQTIRSFRLVTGVGEAPEAGAAAPSAAAGGDVGKPAGAVDPLRQIRIITLVFAGIGSPEARSNARAAAFDLLKNETGPNLFFSVFSIDERLSILQQYTTNKDLIRKAVTNVTSSASGLYKSESDRIEEEVKTVATQDVATTDVPTPSNGPPNTGALVLQALARLTLNMMQFSQSLDRTQQGRSTLLALESLITQQFRLPGRKTLLYFSEGLTIPADYVDEFHNLIGTANRANVSVYGIDARGLNSSSQNSEGRSLLSQAASGARSQQTQTSGPVTRDQATTVDRSMEAIQANSLNSLQEISDKTGGFMIANTNDLRTGLHRVTEEVDTHYEISYSPDIRALDGHFRKIAVTVARPDMKVQTRSGYYALPFVAGQTLMSYELPMLNALTAAALPHDVSFRSSGLHFKSSNGDAKGGVVIDVPLDGIQFTKDEPNHKYDIHFSVLAQFKDSDGIVVKKLSQDIPRQGPIDKIDAFKLGHFIYSQFVTLPPGRYALETAVIDRQSGKVSAKKTSFLVPAADSIGVSSLVRVRNVTPREGAASPASDDPLDVATGKISPGLDETAKGGAGSVLSYFFTVYTQPGSKAPDLSMEFYRDGQLLGRGAPPLPAPDANGKIPYIASTPLDSFKPGQYELRVIVAQNGKSATERTMFTVE